MQENDFELGRIFAFIVLIVLILAMTVASTPSNYFPAQNPLTASSPRSNSWWDLAWRFRTLVNLTSTIDAQGNQTVLVWVTIPYGRVISAFRELRLVDQSLTEVPSTVLYEQKQSSFTLGAALLFRSSVPGGASRQFQIYYGNPNAFPPLYRRAAQASNYGDGPVSLNLRTDSETVAYRTELYSNFYATKFRYNNTSASDYGPVAISNFPMIPVSPWRNDPPTNSTFSVNMVGTLVDVRVLSAVGKALAVSDLVVDQGSGQTVNVLLSDVFDATVMSTRGLVIGGFNSTDNIAFAAVGTNTVGIRGQLNPSGYEIASSDTVVSEARNMILSNSTRATGNIALAMEWSLGDILKGGYAILTRQVTFEAGYANLTRSLSRLSLIPRITLSDEQSLATPLLSGVTMFLNQVQSQNLAVPSGGYTSNYSAVLPSWSVITSSLAGDASYSVPGTGDYDFEDPTVWSTVSSSGCTPGQCISYSSAHSWSEARQSYTAAVHLFDNDTTSVAQASVISRLINVVGAESVQLFFSYRLNHNLTGGQPSAYIQLKFDRSLDHQANMVYYISGVKTMPLSNSSVMMQNDGVWHSSLLDLTSLKLASDFKFAVNIFASTNGTGAGGTGVAAKGIVELEVDNIYLRIKGSAQNILTVGLDPFTSTVSVSYARQGLNTSVLDPDANVTLSYYTVAPLPINELPNGLSSASFAPPSPNNTTLANETILMMGVQDSTLRIVSLNGTRLDSSQYLVAGDSLIIQGLSFQTITGSHHLVPFTLSIWNSFHTLTITPVDAGGATVPNLALSALDRYGRVVQENSTRSLGALLTLVPFYYDLRGYYQGVQVYKLSLNLTSDVSLKPQLPIYRITFQVRDLFGNPITGSDVLITRNGTSVYEASSDGGGRVSLQMVANIHYGVTVSYQGQRLVSQDFTPAANDLRVTLSTNYTPFISRIVVTVSLIGTAAAMIFFLYRRTRRAKKSITRGERVQSPSTL